MENRLRKNAIEQIEITAMSSQGSGIGRIKGMAVFVPDSAIGDILEVKILKVDKTMAFAKIEKIIGPSPHRTEQDCPVSGKCGGCTYRHISYEAELEAKYQRVSDALKRIGGLEITPEPIIGADTPERYRNKAQLPIGQNTKGELQMGFFAPHSHRIVDNRGCLLQPEVFDKAAELVRRWVTENNISIYNESAHKGLLRHLYLRWAEATDEVMVCLVINGDTLPKAEELTALLKNEIAPLKSVVININKAKTNVILGEECRTIRGSDHITDILCGLKFKISPLSFYQVNRTQAEKLYMKAAEYANLTGSETVLDLYCGAGTIGLSMAAKAREIIGVEIVEQAVSDAIENARINNITNARFICKDAAAAALELQKEGIRPHIVVIDPPRKGCDKALIDTIAQMNPDRVVYVSCDPATLARDLAIFAEKGYPTLTATPLDMFPRTPHVECVVLMSRIKD